MAGALIEQELGLKSIASPLAEKSAVQAERLQGFAFVVSRIHAADFAANLSIEKAGFVVIDPAKIAMEIEVNRGFDRVFSWGVRNCRRAWLGSYKLCICLAQPSLCASGVTGAQPNWQLATPCSNLGRR